MKRSAGLLLMAAIAAALAGCAPAALRPQANAAVQVEANLAEPPLTTPLGERVYTPPAPGELRVRTDRDAFITSLLVTPSGVVQVLPVGAVQAGAVTSVALPSELGSTQVYTVASLQPLDLTAAQGTRGLSAAAQVVQQQASGLPGGSYNVVTTTYRVVRLGTLNLDSFPKGAEVRYQGKLLGYTPLTLEDMPEGRVELQLRRTGFVPRIIQVNVLPNAVRDVWTELQFAPPRITGTLRVTSSVPARVIVEGRALGQTPLSVKLPPGTVGVNVVPLDTRWREQTLLVRIAERQTTPISCAVVSQSYTCQTQ